MSINPIYGRFYNDITTHRYYLCSLISIFFLILIGYFITWPIVGYDTDLWYHLSGGRYLWQNGTIPRDAFFSFVTPPKSWYNYYWLFQAIVYQIFQYTGYYGLIAFRCLLYFLLVLFICFFLIERDNDRKGLLVSLFFFVSYPLALMGRELLVRPHLFSYLFIVVFLYILEFKRDKAWLLPFLGVLWCNIHGIEYPVMILIVLAYLLEIYYHDIRKISRPGEDKKTKWSLILTMYTVFLTPRVVELIRAPFDITYDNALHQYLYISELLPLDLKSLFAFSIFPLANITVSFQRGLVIASFCFVLLCLYKKKLRISHLIIFLASIALLVKHNRFIFEFMLLSIPLVRQGIASVIKPQENKSGFFHWAAPVLMIFILIVVPFLSYGSQFKNRPEYPFTHTNLPTGVVKFLNDLDTGGSIMNYPDRGGYFHWGLQKKYKIYMDMELSLFSDYDYAYINNALHDENTFRLFIRQYDPAFISAPLERPYFKEMIGKFPDFIPVFYDDSEALYVNVKRFPSIADAHELKYIDPFHNKNIKYEKETKEKLSLLLAEAMRLRGLYPDCGITNSIIANILMVNKQHQEALPYADAIISRYPEIAAGYVLKADALFLGPGRFEEAASLYRKAIDRGLSPDMGNVYRNLAVCYIRLKEFKKAYQVLSGFINPFNLQSGYKDIYELAMSAAAVGKMKDALSFLKIAELKLPPDDAEYAEKIKKGLLIVVGPGAKKTSAQ